MSGSYRRINYSVRPAKNIERKMLAEAFQRLVHIEALNRYRYIGFGSTYFSDFALFHRSLGIHNMLSIEKDKTNSERFEFNKPFQCIQLDFGHSNNVLPTLQWDVRTILWLDYDKSLDNDALVDVSFFCANAKPGSVIVVTANAQPDEPDFRKVQQPFDFTSELISFRYQKLSEDVGTEKVPLDVDGRMLNGWGKAQVCRRIITNEIAQTLTIRNGGLEGDKRIKYRQLFNFHYADNAKMLTVGGILYEESQEATISKCAFEELPFVRLGDDPYEIEAPVLTLREIRHLDRFLPVVGEQELNIKPIPDNDVKKYARLYRYFPTFAETEI